MKKSVVVFLILTNIASFSFYNTLKKEKNNFGNCGTFLEETSESVLSHLVLAQTKTILPDSKNHLLREIFHTDTDIANINNVRENPYTSSSYYLHTLNVKKPDNLLIPSIFKPPKFI